MSRATLWALLLLVALGAPSASAQQARCAAALARIAPQACAEPGFLGLWQTMDMLERADAQPSRARFEATLRVCRGVPGSDPLPCLERRIWKRISDLARAGDPASAVGRYLGPEGRAVALWPADAAGYTRVRISLPLPSDRGCALTLETWRLRGEQTFVGERMPGEPASFCDFKLRRIGRDVVVAGDRLCRATCAPDVDYAGRYRLQR
jgi:hypothetical protein